MMFPFRYPKSFGSLLLLGAAPQISLSVPTKPTTRFTRYARQQQHLTVLIDGLGYTEDSWNKVTAGFEKNQYSKLPVAILSTIQKFMDSTSSAEARWNCWVNHYRDYSWGELETQGVQNDYLALGYTSAKWNGLDPSPTKRSTSFGSLTSSEQKAAGNLCYEDWSWNNSTFPDTVAVPSGTALSCFSSFNEVNVRGRGLVTVDKLEIGAYVMGRNGAFSRVYSLSHHDPLVIMSYLQISLVGVQKPLEISKEHMVFVNNKMVRASEVKRGDRLGNMFVDEITLVQRQGAYAPITESGDIIVSGVLASSYIAILDNSPVDQHFATHALMSPIRLLCSIDFGICEKETYTNGYSDWIYNLMKMAQTFNLTSGPVLQAVASWTAWPILVAIYIMVEVLLHPLPLLVVSVRAAFYIWRTVKQSRVLKAVA